MAIEFLYDLDFYTKVKIEKHESTLSVDVYYENVDNKTMVVNFNILRKVEIPNTNPFE